VTLAPMTAAGARCPYAARCEVAAAEQCPNRPGRAFLLGDKGHPPIRSTHNDPL
jgi:hypothetical protein